MGADLTAAAEAGAAMPPEQLSPAGLLAVEAVILSAQRGDWIPARALAVRRLLHSLDSRSRQTIAAVIRASLDGGRIPERDQKEWRDLAKLLDWRRG